MSNLEAHHTPCWKCCSSFEQLSDLIVPHSWPWWPLSCALRIFVVSSARASPKTYLCKEKSLFLEIISLHSSPYSRWVLEYFSVWKGLPHPFPTSCYLFPPFGHLWNLQNTFGWELRHHVVWAWNPPTACFGAQSPSFRQIMLEGSANCGSGVRNVCWVIGLSALSFVM